MKRYASTLLPILLGIFLGTGADAPAQDLPAQQFVGVAGGWTYEPDPPTASTFITSDGATGFILFFCDRTGPGFFMSLSAAAENQDQRSDGLLQIFPARGQPENLLLAQFSVRFPEEHAFHSTQLRPPITAQPKRFLDLIRDYPSGIRLNIVRLRHDRFTPPRQVELFLPQTSDNDGLPMEVALPLIEESCRVR